MAVQDRCEVELGQRSLPNNLVVVAVSGLRSEGSAIGALCLSHPYVILRIGFLDLTRLALATPELLLAILVEHSLHHSQALHGWRMAFSYFFVFL